jgi:hypothetical protein
MRLRQATISNNMVHKIRFSAQWVLPITIGVCLLALFAYIRPVSALTPLPNPDPKPGSFGLEATKTQPPPKQGASITTPGNGTSFSTSPITVNGICPNDLLVQVYDNGVMVGSVMCKNGSFSLEVSLFAGANELSALVYDELDQAGPPSNIVTVTYTDTRFTAFGSLITLTSSYGRRSAAAGSQLGWPLQLSGGTGPYAFSLDWGDGVPVELKSQSLTGIVAIAHTYKKAGIYQANVKVTDVNGVSAFLQVIALANGKVDGTPSGDKTSDTAKPQILWIPTVASLVLLVPSFWLGRLSQVVSLRNKMLKERDSFKEK